MLTSYWNNAISFQEYLEVAKQRIENPKDAEEADYKGYYELGLQRMERTLKTFKLTEELEAKRKEKDFKGKVLIISEPWCGDASATVPALNEFFKGHNEVRIFLRDSDETLINQFLTNGGKSIPIALFLDENDEVIAHWGPRPKYGQELLARFKADPENYTTEEFHNDLQVYYAKNKGVDALEEILELL